MTHIEEYYNKFLDKFIDKNNPSLNNRENVRKYSAYAFQPTLDAFIHLETQLRKEFDQKLQKLQNQRSLEEKLKKQQEEIDALKKALADTLAALAAK
jgi:hypothetical protein